MRLAWWVRHKISRWQWDFGPPKHEELEPYATTAKMVAAWKSDTLKTAAVMIATLAQPRGERARTLSMSAYRGNPQSIFLAD
jgi:hypothetical protein